MDNSLFAQGKAQDAIDKAINNAQTNTKIFGNTQAYNIQTMNEAAKKNAEFSIYTDEVNTALQEYDNTRLQDLENLKDVEITRRDNADKPLELNMQNPIIYTIHSKDHLIFITLMDCKNYKIQVQMKSFEQIYSEVSAANPSISAEEKRLLK